MEEPPAAAGNRMKKRNRFSQFPLLPTLLTLGNGFCGLLCITLLTKSEWLVDAEWQETVGDARIVSYAGMLLFVAMLFDLLDGQVARLTKQTSDFGAQLDSLCDVVSFGIAPVYLLMTCTDAFHPRLLWGIGALFAACAVLRLARYNVEKGEEHESGFTGLPSPAAAGTVASFAIVFPLLHQAGSAEPTDIPARLGALVADVTPELLPMMMFVMALLMVSRIPYPHVFDEFFRGNRNLTQFVQLLFVLIAIFTVHELALPLIFSAFALAPPAQLAWLRITRRWQEAIAR